MTRIARMERIKHPFVSLLPDVDDYPPLPASGEGAGGGVEACLSPSCAPYVSYELGTAGR